jgi:hypothetical protein
MASYAASPSARATVVALDTHGGARRVPRSNIRIVKRSSGSRVRLGEHPLTGNLYAGGRVSASVDIARRGPSFARGMEDGVKLARMP